MSTVVPDEEGWRTSGRLANRDRKDLRFEGIKYHVFQGRGLENKFILKDISGVFKSGQLSAIMGPSGAGKSSLMNILAGYRTRDVLGTISVNRQKRNLEDFRKMSCYIMQDDMLLPHLSVDEAMMCSVNLKLEESTPSEAKRQIIDDILTVLSLKEAVHTRTSQLSGGQKKRLAIAQELVNNPPVMFFDEPTSGLDSASCQQCISLLRTLARGGRTVICTIHQPSAKIFEMFDNLYFLADGHCIYRGPVKYLVPYLATQGLICPSYHNPADYFMEVACGEHGNNVIRLAQAVRKGILHRNLTAIIKQNGARYAGEDILVTSAHTINEVENGKSLHRSESDNAVGLNHRNQLLAVKTEPDQVSNGEVVSLLPRRGSFGSNRGEFTSASLLDVRSNCPLDPEELDEENPHKDGQQGKSQERSFATSWLTQFRILLIRSFFTIVRDTTLTHLRLVSHVAVGVLIGLLYFRIGNMGTEIFANGAFIFFSLLFLMFAAIMPTVMTFPIEMSIVVREHLNYWYSLKAYYMAKSVADFPFQIIFPVVYTCIVYWLTDQPAEVSRFVLIVSVCVLTALVGQSLGLLIGAATPLQVAIFVGPVASIPILLFSGFFLNLDLIPKYLQWVSYISYTRYSFSAAMKATYGLNRSKLDCSRRRPTRVSFPCIQNPALVLDAMNVEQYDMCIDFLVLLLFFFALRVLGYFALRWRIKLYQ
ncbi:unnamed protein product [Calicophoron daubneyi]|uniref:ABC transporter domain-containing protein n=1 Tax=Calicophoron daubneyi TaxID=300641 RepID=A0AAV2TXI9_CALDB